MSSKWTKCDDQSRSSTSCDSEREQPRVLKTNILKHKTQLCKNYSQKGYCNYKEKCRFAHGRDELVVAAPRKHYRQKKCEGFWRHGCCKYGIRCQFGHAELDWHNAAALLGLQATLPPKPPQTHSKLAVLLAC